MIIILEGPDGSGKSTLAEQLRKQTGYLLMHRSYPKTEEDKKRMAKEYELVIKSNRNCILDRCWYSEMVYGPVMRDEHVIPYTKMYELERLLAKRGAIVIYCSAPEQVLWDRCTSRGEDYVTDRATFSRICEGYNAIMHDIPHLIPVVNYEYKEM